MASSSAAPQPTTTASEVSIENQSTFLLWFHNCFIGCPSHWHDTPSSPSTTYILATFETDFFANTSILNAKDIKIWRLDLLANSDGDATKRSKHQGDVLAEEEFMEKWLNTLERECEKSFDGEFLLPLLALDIVFQSPSCVATEGKRANREKLRLRIPP